MVCAPLVLVCGSGCQGLESARRIEIAVQEWREDGLVGRRYVTTHFELISTLHDREFEKALPEFLEAAYGRYEQTLPPVHGDGPKMSVFLFGNRSQWEYFAKEHYPLRFSLYSRIRSGGFTEGDTSVSFYSDRASTLATLAHEGWHQYAATRFPFELPAWLNEGFACYHEAVECAGSKPVFTPHRNTFRINPLREAVLRDRLLSLEDILVSDAGQVMAQDNSAITQTFYAQAWGLVRFLQEGRGGHYSQSMRKLLGDISNGSYPVKITAARVASIKGGSVAGSIDAFEAYFGGDFPRMNEEYYGFLVRTTGLK
ncbi:MAG: DUF1570 domain-containing protein [Planctomycetota bacterium]